MDKRQTVLPFIRSLFLQAEVANTLTRVCATIRSILETCQSGRTYLFAKEAGCKSPRGFESRRLRNDIFKYRSRYFKVASFERRRDSKGAGNTSKASELPSWGREYLGAKRLSNS